MPKHPLLIILTIVFLLSVLSSFAFVPQSDFTFSPATSLALPVNAQTATYTNPFIYGIKTDHDLGALPGITGKGGGITACTGGDFGQCVLWLLDKALRLVYTIALFWAVIMLVWTGVHYISSRGEVKDIHKSLIWALWGVVVAVLSFGIVKGLELTLTGGEQVGVQVAGGPTGGSISTATTTGGPITGSTKTGSTKTGTTTTGAAVTTQVKPLISITDFIYEPNTRTFKGFYTVSPEGSTCDLSAAVYNITKSTGPKSDTIGDTPIFKLEIPDNTSSGDLMRIKFTSYDCQIDRSIFSYTIPKGVAELTPVDVNVSEISIWGSQYYNISLNDRDKDLLENILTQAGLFFAQSNFYSPPFFGYFKYTANNPNKSEVSCTIRALLRGVRVSNIPSGIQNRSLSFVAFTYPISVYLRIKPTPVETKGTTGTTGTGEDIIGQIIGEVIEGSSGGTNGPLQVTTFYPSLGLGTYERVGWRTIDITGPCRLGGLLKDPDQSLKIKGGI
jgi:hypothetical protein